MTKSLEDNTCQEGSPGICKVAVIPIRNEPREQSEMISQLLFGEYYIINEIRDRWINITSHFDHYTGWIDRKFFQEASFDLSMNPHVLAVLSAGIAEIDMPDGTSQLIPAGSNLQDYNDVRKEFMIDSQRFKVRSLLGNVLLPPTQDITETARQFLNTPYLWGGRSVFGYDCSGFTQTLYKIHGISLPRDTNQQVLAGRSITGLNEVVPGDLAFFCNEEGKVNHVGIIMAGGQIIHCSGWVRIDRLDEKGIFNRERDMYTHLFMEVRRVAGKR